MYKRSASRSSGGSSPLESRSPSPSAYADTPRPGMDTELSARNVGHAMLLRMGWTPGKGLGVEGTGRVQPVPISEKRGADLTGIGKAAFDRHTIDKATAQRRELTAERMLNETESQRSMRLEEARRQATIQQDVLEARAAFRCELCDKGYAVPSAYETHLTSYDHHHRKRLKELHAAEKSRTSTSGALDKRRAKEAVREAKEMAKLAGAAGVALSPASVSTSTPSNTASISSGGGGGWKAVGASGSSSGAGAGWKSVRSGWSAVGVSAPSSASSSTLVQPQTEPRLHSATLTSFKSSGFSTLDTTEASGSTFPVLASSAPVAVPSSRSGFAPVARTAPTVAQSTGFRKSGFAPVPFSVPARANAAAAPPSSSGAIAVSGALPSFSPIGFASTAAVPPCPPGAPPPPPASNEVPPPPPLPSEPFTGIPPPPPPGPPPGPPPMRRWE